ncbi:MAG: phosphoribulokinase/uridine kinase [Alphaproteobacteria bacterium]
MTAEEGSASYRSSPLFWAGLLLRVAAVCLLVPQIQSEWFVPFVRGAVTDPGLDPWTQYLAAGGAPQAFPYGPVMLLVFVPLTGAGAALDTLLGTEGFAGLGFRATLVIFDLALLLLLARLWPEARGRVLWLYWTSPIVLFITYWHGQIDIVPTVFLVSALVLLRERAVLKSAAALGLSVSAKLSTAIAAPFIFLFFLNNHIYRPDLLRSAAVFSGVFLLFQGLYLFSPGVERMMLESPEFGKIYDIRIGLSEGMNLYIVPLAYFLSLYLVFLLPRMNFQLLMSVLGVGFLIFLLLTPASVGWFLWFVPFLVDYQVRHPEPRRAALIGTLFSVLLIAYKLPVVTGAVAPLAGLDAAAPLLAGGGGPWQQQLLSLLLSVFVASGILLAVSALRRGLNENDFYLLARRPVGIGIAGDSGAGKDTLAEALRGMFGRRNVAELRGDDYHRYERGAPIWEVVTHLDPRANDLHAFTRDALTLLRRGTVSRQRYDHGTGRFIRPQPIRSNHTVIVSGLHVFFSRQLTEALDVRVFLSPDEALRRRFKSVRDVAERGKTPDQVVRCLESRWPDSVKYIQPQAAHADLVFSLQAPDEAPPDSRPPSAALRVMWKDAPQFQEFLRVMIGVCGTGVDVLSVGDSATVELLIHCHDLAPEDTRAAALCLVPRLEELLARDPVWQGGALGVMQLLVLLEIVKRAQARRSRRG